MMNSRLMLAAALAAASIPAVAGGRDLPTQAFRFPTPKRVRNYPKPQCSSPEVIAAWNAEVDARKAAKRARCG